jgi:hypothetical protein
MSYVPDVAFMPLTGNPLPDGTPVGIDSIHAQIANACPWPLANPVLHDYPAAADIVLVAVPEGMGQAVALFLADQLRIVETVA